MVEERPLVDTGGLLIIKEVRLTMSYAVVRTDLMHGSYNAADLVSLRFCTYASSTYTPAEVENGVIAKLVELETHGSGASATYEREVWTAIAATGSDTSFVDCVLVDGVEIMYDERKKKLNEYINEAGKAVRGYRLRQGDIFSVTKEGFASATAPTSIGASVYVGANGKLATSGTTVLGKFIHTETIGGETWYAIKVGAISD